MKSKRIWTWLLIISLLVANVTPVYAAEEMESTNSESIDESNETELTTESVLETETVTVEESETETVEESETKSQETEDDTKEETESEETEETEEETEVDAYEITKAEIKYSEVEVGSTQTITVYLNHTKKIKNSVVKLFAEDKGAEVQYNCTHIGETEIVFEINHKDADWYFVESLWLETENGVEKFNLLTYENLDYWVTGQSQSVSMGNGISFYSNNRYTGVNGNDDVFIIVLDPGHDPVCSNRSWTNGVWETELNWKIAEVIKKELEGYLNVKVYINKTWEECPEATDGIECLKARVTRAANLKADLVVSLHNNAVGSGALQTSSQGAEVYVTRYPGYNAESKGVAEQILAELESIGLKNRGVKTRYYGDDATDTYDDGTGWDYYAINRHSTLMGIPSVLIEHAYMDNAYDLQYLKDSSKLEQIGKCDAKAIIKYYNLKKITEPMGELSVEQFLSGKLNINVNNVAAPYQIKEVHLRVYDQGTGAESANWFEAAQNGKMWSTTFKPADYAMKPGTYVADLYYVDATDKYNQVKSIKFQISTLPEVYMEAVEKDASQGTFDVSVNYDWPENQITEVYVEAWCNEDMSDSYKYLLQKQEDGKYSTQLNVKNHGYHIGKYQIDCYVKEKNGEITKLGSITHEVNLKVKSITEEKSEDGYFSVISLEGVQTQGVEGWISFMVWSNKNGQDDIKAYSIEGSGEKRSIEIPLYDYKDIGSYSVHVYVMGKDGKLHFLTQSSFEVTEVPISEMNIISEDKVNGTFDANVILDLPKGSFNSVYVEAWTESDQSDLYCYEAKAQSDGTYCAQVNVKNHGYHIGTYQLKCYTKNASGKRTDVAVCEKDVAIEAGNISVVKSEDGYSMVLNMKNIKTQGIENWLTFMVWSDKNGQDDIKGYTAISKNGICEIKIPLCNYNDTGNYTVHTYTWGKDGKMHFLNESSFEVAEIPTSEMKVVSEDRVNGTFDVSAYIAFSQNSFDNVYVEAWTENDQSDLYCYEAKAQSDGTYRVQVNVKNHGYHIGKYKLVCYIKDVDGNRIDIETIEKNIIIEAGAISSTKSEDGYSVMLSMKDIKTQGIENWLIFMVWSDKNGQDDIKAYTAIRNGAMCYAEIPLINHREMGNYTVHVYVGSKDGKMHFLTQSSFEVTEIPTSEMQVVGEDRINGTFDISAYIAISQNSFEKVYIEAWTENDQSDLFCYEADVQSDGTYRVQVNVKNHGYHIGKYHLKCYVKDAGGKRADVAVFEKDVMIESGEISAIKSEDGYYMILRMEDIKTQGAENWLTFMVWSDKNGQDDIKGYSGISENGKCEISIPIFNHNDIGKYTIHVYMRGKDGKQHFLKSNNFTVDILPKTRVQVENINQAKGTFDVKVYLPQRLDVQKMRIPVWTNADQSDIYWYTAITQKDGYYQITVDATNHQWNSGKYNIHAYAVTNVGLLEYVDSSSVNIELGIGIRENRINNLSTKIKVYGVSSDVLSVRFPTWSKENGQDDIYWYNGQKNADGTWSVDVHSKHHSRAGNYITHVYIDFSNGSEYAGNIEFYIAEKQKPGWKWIDGYKRYINEDGEIDNDVSRLVKGPYFIKVYKWSNYLIVYAKDEYGNFTVPVKAMIASCGNNTPTGTYYTPNRWRWLTMVDDSKAQWCTQIIGDYLFHSVPYRTADPTTLYVDNKFNYLGQTKSLGCIRLQAGDAKWIYDNCQLGTKVLITPSESSGPIEKPSFTPLPSWHTWDPTDPTTKYLCQKYECH